MTVPRKSTWEVLRSLGFAEDPTVTSDSPGGLSFEFGDLRLSAAVCINRSFAPVILLCGVMSTRRTIADLECELPREVESWEQGVALVTWCLDKNTGGIFQAASSVAWVAQGRQYYHLLPWERERAAYAARPHCQVDRDWVRVALRKLAEEVATADDDAPITLHFDGELFRMWCAGTLIAMPASGAAWATRYSLDAGLLRRLPKRLMGAEVEFSIWNSALTIGNMRYAGVLAIDEERP